VQKSEGKWRKGEATSIMDFTVDLSAFDHMRFVHLNISLILMNEDPDYFSSILRGIQHKLQMLSSQLELLERSWRGFSSLWWMLRMDFLFRNYA